MQTADYFFVGPDNGVLSFALARERIRAVHQITNRRLFLQPVSRTFHGRDIFAPIAARLSNGLPIGKVGPALKNMVKLDWPQPRVGGNSIEGEIIYLDRFGNAITNISEAALSSPDKFTHEVFMKRKRLGTLQPFYQTVPRGKPLAVIGSTGFLEIAVNGGSAAKLFRVQIGEIITVRRKPTQSTKLCNHNPHRFD